MGCTEAEGFGAGSCRERGGSRAGQLGVCRGGSRANLSRGRVDGPHSHSPQCRGFQRKVKGTRELAAAAA
eukprot:1147985-Pelagomonas_calceolata.AAC.4